MIRRFSFYNNIIGGSVAMVPTEYCVWGYYDGVQIDVYDSLEELSHASDSYVLHTQTEKVKNEIYEIYELTCFRNAPDDFFWKKAELPYIFLSCLRFKKKSLVLDAIIRQFENDGMVCYWTLDSSDLIVCYRSSSFRYGMNKIKEYDELVQRLEPDNGVNISFSTLLIAQTFLDNLYNLVKQTQPDTDLQITASDETVFGVIYEKFSVLLRLNVKNLRLLDKFKEKLHEYFPKTEIDRFLLLGNTDAILLLKEVDSIHFLCQFSKQGFLVHSHKVYKEIVYNVQSEILMQEGEDS